MLLIVCHLRIKFLLQTVKSRTLLYFSTHDEIPFPIQLPHFLNFLVLYGTTNKKRLFG
jgi:hypothetical protein